jgi:carbamoyltransferase
VTAILGLNAYHGDAAAALVVDGELVAAVEEERFTRVKHTAGFPGLSAAWCLRDAGLSPSEVEHVAVSRDPRANLGAKLRWTLRHGVGVRFARSRLANAAKVRDVRLELARALGVAGEEVAAQLHPVEHHRAHAASAFLVSPFDEAAVLTVDGFGDFASTLLGHGRGGSVEVLGRVLFPHSLGVLYTALCQWLGFAAYGDEGKVMGLAPYGRPRYVDRLADLVVSDGAGAFRLGLPYFVHHREGVDMTWSGGTPTIGRLYSERLVKTLGPPRAPRAPVERLHEDVAASLQAIFEDTYLALVRSAYERTGSRCLCLAGGVALNAVANGRILRDTPFTDLWIQPAAGDSGTAVGAAFHVWNETLAGERRYVMEHAYTGPAYEEEACAAALGSAGLEAGRLADDELFSHAARAIADGLVVGWFQGRMELGPRALGSRSIVADPRRADMKDVLNARIKHREPFRPFAPSILAEATGEWFEQDHPSPFMVLVYRTREDKRDRIPAVNHVDDTGRLQTVERALAPRYYRLIEEFARLTGVPLVINTSFNESEPIVMTPAHAVDCFVRTRMDVLVLGNLVVRRDDLVRRDDASAVRRRAV